MFAISVTLVNNSYSLEQAMLSGLPACSVLYVPSSTMMMTMMIQMTMLRLGRGCDRLVWVRQIHSAPTINIPARPILLIFDFLLGSIWLFLVVYYVIHHPRPPKNWQKNLFCQNDMFGCLLQRFKHINVYLFGTSHILSTWILENWAFNMLQYISICCNILQYISMYFNIFQYISIYFNIFQYVCSVIFPPCP